MKPLSRRSVTTGLAAAVTAIPAVGLCKGAEGPSELAATISRYFAEVDAFNNSQPFDATLREMIGVPVRSGEDALAAVKWVIQEGSESVDDLKLIERCGEQDLFAQIAASLLHGLHGAAASAGAALQWKLGEVIPFLPPL